MGTQTHIDIVVKLYAPRAIELHLLQCLSDNIIGLALGSLGGLDCIGLLNVALVINIELAECLSKAKDVLLLELGILSAANLARFDRKYVSATNLCSLRTFMILLLEPVALRLRKSLYGLLVYGVRAGSNECSLG